MERMALKLFGVAPAFAALLGWGLRMQRERL